MADNSRLIHLLPLPHLVVGATVIVGEDTAVEEDVAVALQDLILEVEGTEAVVAEVETDSLSLLRVVEKGDISPNRMLAGMTMAVQEEAAAVAVADMVVIADVVSLFCRRRRRCRCCRRRRRGLALKCPSLSFRD